MSTSSSPHPLSFPCPLAASLWLRRAARRFGSANESLQFYSPGDIAVFLRIGQPVGGFAPPFAGPLSDRIRQRVSFDVPRSGAELDEAYRRCALEEFYSELCDVDRKAELFAIQLEMETEGQGIVTACDVFTSLAVAMDVGDRNSSLGAQIARMFGSKLRHVSSWALVVGWKMIAHKLGSQHEGVPGGVAGSMAEVGDYLLRLLPPTTQGKVVFIDGVLRCSDGIDAAQVSRWREEVVGEWREMLAVAKRLRSSIGAHTYACITHRHTPTPPAHQYRCGDPKCDVHHFGIHASEQFERMTLLVSRLEGELAILSAG